MDRAGDARPVPADQGTGLRARSPPVSYLRTGRSADDHLSLPASKRRCRRKVIARFSVPIRDADRMIHGYGTPHDFLDSMGHTPTRSRLESVRSSLQSMILQLSAIFSWSPWIA